MTYKERLRQALEGDWRMDDPSKEGRLNSLLIYAYMAGKEKGVQEACDMATKRWQGQLKQAQACRYRKMATAIVGEAAAFTGGRGFVYHTDYAGDYSAAFGNNMWTDD